MSAISGPVLVAFAVIVLLVVLSMAIIGVMKMIRKVSPNTALIVTGVGCKSKVSVLRKVRQPDGKFETVAEEQILNFKIIKGGMAIVFPMVQEAKALDLRVYEEDIKVTGVLSQDAVPINVEGVVQIAIGEDDTSIITAARLHLDKDIAVVLKQASETLQGHLRAIIGQMVAGNVYKDREGFAQQVFNVAYEDMAGLGINIVSFVIKEVSDDTEYYQSLGQKEIWEARKNARMAQAEAERLATEKEQDAEKLKAEYRMTTAMAKAGYDSEVAKKQAIAEQAKAIALAEQQMTLEERQTKTAEVAAQRTNMELEAQVRRPADAARYRIQQEAEANRFKIQQEADAGRYAAEQEAEASRLKGFATADVVEAQGTAQGEADKAKGLAQAEVVKAGRLAEAEGVRASLLAEAEGKRKLADALNGYDENALRQVLGLAMLSGVPKVADAFGQALANVKEIRLVDIGGDNGNGDGKGTFERFMNFLPETLFKFLQSASALIAGPIDDLVAAGVVELARKAGVKMTPEQQEAVKEKVVAMVAGAEKPVTEETSVSSETRELEVETQAESPVEVPKEEKPPRRRRLTKKQEAQKAE